MRVEHEEVVQPRNDTADRRKSLAEVLLLVALRLRHAVRTLKASTEGRRRDLDWRRSDLHPRRCDEEPPAGRAEQHRDRIS